MLGDGSVQEDMDPRAESGSGSSRRRRAGVRINGGTVAFTNCDIYSNTARYGGGGVRLRSRRA